MKRSQLSVPSYKTTHAIHEDSAVSTNMTQRPFLLISGAGIAMNKFKRNTFSLQHVGKLFAKLNAANNQN